MKPEEVLCPLSENPKQVYLGRGVHTLGLIDWILKQIGPADVIVTTFSTSIEFLSGFHNLIKKGLVKHATMVADLKACKKTVKLMPLMDQCFNEIYLAENHSKIVLLGNAGHSVCVISSQNNTYGGRIECTYMEENLDLSDKLLLGIRQMTEKSLKRK